MRRIGPIGFICLVMVAAVSFTMPLAGQITAGTYPFSSAAGVALENMSTGTTQLVSQGQDNNASAVTPIGFTFWYAGAPYTQLSVSVNGLVRLGGVPVSTGTTNSLASPTDAPKIAAYWDDLCTGANGEVHYKVVGNAPNQKLVVEWRNMQITRNGACGGFRIETFQLWLFETSNTIQLVYGALPSAAAVDGGYSVGLQSGPATSFASVTTAGPTASYAAANNTQLAAIPAGTSYSFTAVTPADPTGLSFTGTTASSTTLHWTDNSGIETGFEIYRSTDGGTTYALQGQVPANTTSFADSVLQFSGYVYQVFAAPRGPLSVPATGFVSTPAANSVSSTQTTGNWSNPATWVGGVLPTSNDRVTIVDGASVTIDVSPTVYGLTVGNVSTAFLQFEPTTARTLTVLADVTVNIQGAFRSAMSGTQVNHVLSVAGNLLNSGTLDFSTNANTAGAGIVFTGSRNAVFNGSGLTTDVRSITINKGTTPGPNLWLSPGNFTVRGVTTDTVAGGWLVMANGTFRLSGFFAGTSRVFAAASYTVPASFGFWLDNPNYTVAGQAGSATNSGVLRVSQGTLNVGTGSDNSMNGDAGAAFVIGGGTTNVAGRFSGLHLPVSYTQTGGVVNVCTVGNSQGFYYSFQFAVGTFTMSGGTINLVQINSDPTPANRLDYNVSAVPNITGGTLNVGTGATTGNAGNFDFRLFGYTPDLVVDNTTNNKNAVVILMDLPTAPALTIFGNTTIKAGASLSLNGFRTVVVGPTFTNDGTLNGTPATSRLYFQGTGAQTYTGSGTTTAAMASFEVDNAAGLMLTPTNQILTNKVVLLTGGITNANKITLGNGAGGTIQIGNATTPTAAGAFDVPVTFNLGATGETLSFLRTTASRSTGPEVQPTRSLTNLTYDDNDATHTLSLEGGDVNVTGTLNLTNGRITTGPNVLSMVGAAAAVRTNGYVDGDFRKSFAAAGSKTFEVGTTNGFSPVTFNVTAGTLPTDVTVKATQATIPGIFPTTKALSRYWTLTSNGLTADLTFNYLAQDVPGTASEGNFKLFRHDMGGFTDVMGTVTVMTHTATVTGIANFSDWTLAETDATPPTATASGDATICQGGMTTIQAALTGTAPWNIAWSDGAVQMGVAVSPATRMVSPATTTAYTVTSVSDGNGAGTSSGSAVVTVVPPPTTATVGGSQTVCTGSATSPLGGNTPMVGTGMWVITMGGTGMFASTSAPNTTFTPAGTGAYALRWIVSNPPCAPSTADVPLTVKEPPTPATAGGPQTICALGTTAGLGGNAPTVGAGQWAVISGGSGAFSDPEDPNATFTHLDGGGPISLWWTIYNAPCWSSSAEVIVTIAQDATTPSVTPPAAVTVTQTLCQ